MLLVATDAFGNALGSSLAASLTLDGKSNEIADGATKGSKATYPMLRIDRPEKVFGSAPAALISQDEIVSLYGAADSIVSGTEGSAPWGATVSVNMARIAIARDIPLYTVQGGTAMDKPSTVDLANFLLGSLGSDAEIPKVLAISLTNNAAEYDAYLRGGFGAALSSADGQMLHKSNVAKFDTMDMSGVYSRTQATWQKTAYPQFEYTTGRPLASDMSEAMTKMALGAADGAIWAANQVRTFGNDLLGIGDVPPFFAPEARARFGMAVALPPIGVREAGQFAYRTGGSILAKIEGRNAGLIVSVKPTPS